MSSLVREVAPALIGLPIEEQLQTHRVMDRLVPPQPASITPSKVGDYDSSLKGMGGAVKEAVEAGFTIVSGTPDRLLLDLDKGAVLNEANLELLCEINNERPLCTRWPSKSKKGEHVVLQFAKTTFTPAEAIALEVALGSDSKRAVLYIRRIKNNIAEPRVLFKPAELPEPVQW